MIHFPKYGRVRASIGSIKTLVLFLGIVASGCNATVPNGVFSCTDDLDCPSGFFCHASSFCYNSIQTCTPTRACGDVYQCGQIDDGCGQVLDCEDCEPGLVCGAGSHSFSCGCEPNTCAGMGAECGAPASGCGKMLLDCGQDSPCQAIGENFHCNADMRCECVSVNEASACSGLCGAIEDGCGDIINCGECTGDETCGGDGVQNVCGMGECVPRTSCDDTAECGTQSDGCEGRIACGSCEGDDFCRNNQCVCEPKACDQLGFECGEHNDGCGGKLECDTCEDPLICGTWDRRPFVCGGGCSDLGYECGSPFGSSVPECGFCDRGFDCNDSFECECEVDVYDRARRNDTMDSATWAGVTVRGDFKRTVIATLDTDESFDWYELKVLHRSRDFIVEIAESETAVIVDHSCGITKCTGTISKEMPIPTSCESSGSTIKFSTKCKRRGVASLHIGVVRSDSTARCAPYEMSVW